MADTDSSPADRDKIAFARWDRRMRESFRPLLTKKIISEHKRDPVGIHSDALDRVLNYFRRPNLLPHYVIVSTRPFKQLRGAPRARGPPPPPAFLPRRP